METERLILKTPDFNDAKALMDIQNSPFVQKYNCMQQITLEEAKEIIDSEQCSSTNFYLYHKEDHHLIGAIFFTADDLRYGINSLSLSYYLNENDAKKGYMTEALKATVPYMMEMCKLEVITCRIFKDNIASRKLIEKLHFEYEGCLKHAVKASSGIIYDDCLYALHKK